MQLTGRMAWGPPRDRDAALAVLREAVRVGINHIDTSDYYGPYIANEIIREALHPYPKELVIVTKVGARRGPDKSWPAARSKKDLTDAVHDNLAHLGLEALDIVNLRVGGQFGPNEESIVEPLSVLADLQAQGTGQRTFTAGGRLGFAGVWIGGGRFVLTFGGAALHVIRN